MKKILFFFMLLGLSACDKDELRNTCNVENPVEDLPWLKTRIESYLQSDSSELDLSMYAYVAQATYKGETIFLFLNCCPLCNYVPQAYSCQGNLIENDTIDWEVIWEQDRKVIARGEQFECNV